MYRSISPTQAPPIIIPLSFFVNAQFYGLLALMFLDFNSIQDSKAISFVHCITLGVMGLSMFGALFQMLPVLAGVRIENPKIFGFSILVILNIGILSLVFGLGNPILLPLGAIGLGVGIGGFGVSFIYKILRAKFFNKTIVYMLLALIGLLITMVLGEVMLGLHMGILNPTHYQEILHYHMKAGGFGWILMLIMGVSFEVLAMFYVTKQFPKILTYALFPALALIGAFWDFGIGVLAFIFGVGICYILYKRKRKFFDSSLFLWFFGGICLSVFGAGFGFFTPSVLAVIFGYGFVLSIINAMLYKIVPFLVWFHLSFSGILDLPNIREIIPQNLIRFQIFWHLVGFGGFLIQSKTLGGIGFGLSCGCIIIAMSIGIKKYLSKRQKCKIL